MGHIEAGSIVIGPNGEIALPAAVRDRLGLKPGDRVRIAVDEDLHTAVLAPDSAPAAEPPKKYTLDDLFGMGRKLGARERPMTLEEMDDAIAEAAVERMRSCDRD